jgi:hypothetical protein
MLRTQQRKWNINVMNLLKVTQNISNPPLTPQKKQDATVYQNFISYLCEVQHVSGDKPPIIRSLPDSVQQLHVQQTSTYAKPEVASAVLGSG